MRAKLLFFLLGIASAAGVGALVLRGRPSPDFDALRREILDLHQQTIAAHWKKDARFFPEHTADGYFAVQNGEVRHPSRKETAANFERYLSTTTFTEYRDLREPIIGFSKDGSVAWCVVQVKVAGRDRDESGAESPFDLTWAWITLHEKQDGRWIWLGESSGYKRTD
jgi:hypothetical protein